MSIPTSTPIISTFVVKTKLICTSKQNVDLMSVSAEIKNTLIKQIDAITTANIDLRLHLHQHKLI